MLCLQLHELHNPDNRLITINMENVLYWHNEDQDTMPYTEIYFIGSNNSILVTETKEEIDRAVQHLLSGTYVVD